MSKIELTEYKEFFLSQIIRPYQNTLGIENRQDRFLVTQYESTYYLFQNDQWRGMVMDRLSQCFESIDARIFPDGQPKTVLLYWFHEYGIKVIYK